MMRPYPGSKRRLKFARPANSATAWGFALTSRQACEELVHVGNRLIHSLLLPGPERRFFDFRKLANKVLNRLGDRTSLRPDLWKISVMDVLRVE